MRKVHRIQSIVHRKVHSPQSTVNGYPTRNPQPATHDPRLETHDSCPVTRNPQPATRSIFFILTLISFTAFAHSDSVTYRSPLDIPITLAGTFCEIRGSHFHAGIDIRTNGKEGLPVYAIESGHVSRIKVSKTGYGKALYIEHPDGRTSVYAHLLKFSDKIEQQIRKIQYAKESFEVDEYFAAGTITVAKGEVIALSGNSGRSFAPHLHFEIRDTKSEHPLNPLAFLAPIHDNTAPVMNDLFIYKANDSRARLFPQREKTVKRATGYALLKDTLTVGFPQVNFGINTYDGNGAGGKNGVYELTASVDGKEFYRFAMDRLSFDETRYALAHNDYRQNERNDIIVHRLYKLPGDYFSFYDKMQNNGVVQLDSLAKKITITAKDFNGNTSALSFFIRYDAGAPLPDFSALSYDTIFDFRADNSFQNDEVKVFFPKNACYDSLYFNYEKISEAQLEKTYSSVHQIHTEEEPAHLNFTLWMKPAWIPENLKSKFMIVRETKKKKIESKESTWEGDFLKAKTRDFGKYYILADTVPPKIEPVNIYNGKAMTALSSIQIKVKDEIAGLKTYRGEVDGKWVLMEYDEKNDLLTYFFDWRTAPGEHSFTLKVADYVGNEAFYQVKFVR